MDKGYTLPLNEARGMELLHDLRIGRYMKSEPCAFTGAQSVYTEEWTSGKYDRQIHEIGAVRLHRGTECVYRGMDLR